MNNLGHHPATRARKGSLLLVLLGSTMTLSVMAQNHIAVNTTGAAPDPSAVLDVDVSALPANAKKGFLVPRVANALTIGSPVDGLLVYQTTGTTGFYYYDATVPGWKPINKGGRAWDLPGNDLVQTPEDFLGTTGADPLVIKTWNIERMRIDPTGNVAIGQTTANEKVDVAGAVRVQGTVSTTNIGTIRYNSYSAVQAAPPNSTVNYAQHEGYMGPAAGWKKLENDYSIVRNASYTQMSDATCGTAASMSEIPDNILASQTNANAFATPYYNVILYKYVRRQYLFLKNELNVELNQLSGNLTITHGICPGEPITAISIYHAAGTPKAWNVKVSLFHVPYGVDDLSGGFQGNTDPTFACYVDNSGTTNWPSSSAAGWETIPLSSPFVWDGIRNIVVEMCMNAPSIAGSGAIAVKSYTVPGVSPANQLTYGMNARQGAPAGCLTADPAATQCAGNAVSACGMTDAICNGSYVQTSSTNIRPVIRFEGSAASSTTGNGVSGTGDYLNITAGLIVEEDPNWRTYTSPIYIYRGPGSISVENGVYDNGVRLNDQVFDRYFDGRVRPEEADLSGDQRLLSMDEMADFTARNRHLPTMKGRKAWARENGFSLGDLTNQLWNTTETQAIYLTELNDDADLLEALTTDRPLEPLEIARMTVAVKGMNELCDKEKQLLIDDLVERSKTKTDLK